MKCETITPRWNDGRMIEHLRKLFAYEPETGVLTWRVNRYSGNNRAHVRAGDVAGGPNCEGYAVVTVDGQKYKANRVIWALVTGVWLSPDVLVDHRDGNPSNNRWDNLRLATKTENNRNKRKHRNNSTGFKGVSVKKATGKFAAKITVGRRQVHLGYFDRAWPAYRAYCAAARQYHGEFARTL